IRRRNSARSSAPRWRAGAGSSGKKASARSDAVASLSGGAKIEKYVPHAAGSLERPLSDEALERKFRSLAEWRWPGCDARAVLELAWSLDKLPAAPAFVSAAAPP